MYIHTQTVLATNLYKGVNVPSERVEKNRGEPSPFKIRQTNDSASN
jgi:hypothetical protein